MYTYICIPWGCCPPPSTLISSTLSPLSFLVYPRSPTLSLALFCTTLLTLLSRSLLYPLSLLQSYRNAWVKDRGGTPQPDKWFPRVWGDLSLLRY